MSREVERLKIENRLEFLTLELEREIQKQPDKLAELAKVYLDVLVFKDNLNLCK